MPGLGDTIAQLVRNDRLWEAAGRAAPTASAVTLTEVTNFGANPGNLRMLAYVPKGLPPGAPLVVVLHGCTQTAAGYDACAGWSRLAERHGFAVLLPEQQRANNSNGCFNWFQTADMARTGGEAESICQGIAAMVASHRLSPARVYVSGLSAGGAMAAALLATYPEVFAGGAIIAGLPYGAAGSVSEAFEVMGGRRVQPARVWGDLVRRASPHRGPWPRIQVWQGSADTTVRPGNAAELVKQWADLHGVPSAPSVTDEVDGAMHQAWYGADGTVVLESFMVPGLQHGTPLNLEALDVDGSVGRAGPYMLDVGISSTWHQAQSWGLLTAAAHARAEAPRAAAGSMPGASPLSGISLPDFVLPIAARVGNAASVIDQALRSAGLLKSN